MAWGAARPTRPKLVNGLAALPHEVDVAVGLPESASGFTTRARVAVAARVKGGGTALARVGSQMAAEVSPTLLGVMRGSDIVHYPLTVPSPRPPRGIPYIQTLLDTQHHDLAHNFSASEHWYRLSAMTPRRGAPRPW